MMYFQGLAPPPHSLASLPQALQACTRMRASLAHASEAFGEHLRCDEGALYDEVVEIDLSTLEPQISGPFSPDRVTPLSEFADAVRAHALSGTAARKKNSSAGAPLSCLGFTPPLRWPTVQQ